MTDYLEIMLQTNDSLMMFYIVDILQARLGIRYNNLEMMQRKFVELASVSKYPVENIVCG